MASEDQSTNTKPKTSTTKKSTTKKTTTPKTTTPKKTTEKKTTTPKKTTPRPKKPKVEIKPETMEQFIEQEITTKRKKPKGKVFYLVFSLIFYTAAFFYINNVVYNNADLLQSALFAFAALFVVFVFIQFNVHMIIVNFFRLPFIYLIQESQKEIKKEGASEKVVATKKNKVAKTLARYKALFTLTLYTLIILLLMYSQIYNGIMDGDKVLVIITQTALTVLVFLLIVCSWQYLFNILPNILNKSIDAKNGFVLTLSAAVMVIYVVFNIFEITYLAEMMIFVLIIGFIALIGVNLNMIVGEINIFQNLRERKSKTVTRAVFLIFFAFHLYVVLYASVVAYSIYSWDNNSYNFAYPAYEYVIETEVYDQMGNPIEEVYADQMQTIQITEVYTSSGDLMTDPFDEDGEPITMFYDDQGNRYIDVYANNSMWVSQVYDANGNMYPNMVFYNRNVAAAVPQRVVQGYSTFLYYTIVTTSTLGYGDISPSTSYGIALAWGGFLSFYGITFYALSIGFVSNIAIEGVTAQREGEKDDR